MQTRKRVGALLEVLGVYLVGPLIVQLLVRIFGLHLVNPLEKFTVHITNAELITAARQMFALLALQYIGYFLLIIPISWWHGRSRLSAYGLTKAGRSWPALFAAGFGTVAAVTLLLWPFSTLLMADTVYHLNLGETVPWREAFFATSWHRWEFWLFSAVMSWAVIPVLEELLFRGYCQRRLAEDWGDAPAIIGTACLFTFTHRQYLTLNAYNVAIVASLLLLAIGFGTVFAWTRSLLPAILAHAIIDVPMTPPWAVVFLIVFGLGGLLVRRRAIAAVGHVFSNARVTAYISLGLLGIAWAIASQRIEYLAFIAVAMVVVAVGLDAIGRRREGTVAQ